VHPSVELSNAIRISLAPAFLLVAMSNLLGHIMATRQRIIDRYRMLSAEPDVIIAPDEVEYEKRVLRDRVALTNRSINLLTLAIMLIALVIFTIFISLVSPVIDLTLTLTPLFALAMLNLIVAAGLFLRQLQISSRQLQRIGLSS
tara:strand:- start:2 stop:436 length:435 start_codon:yes stop_codon:yes gene_type:complete